MVDLARTGSPAPTAVMSSQLATYSAALAINGLDSDFTHTLNSGPYEADGSSSLTVNLNRRAAISTVNMHNREGCCNERLRDIRVVILGTDGTTVVHTSALLNPANALGSPASTDL